MSTDVEDKTSITEIWFTKPTGDPYVDAGGFAIEVLKERFPDKNIMGLIEYITKVYVEKWGAGLHSFFLNSKITQGAFDNKKKTSETLRYFNELFTGESSHELGWCRITGQETKLFPCGRDNSIMTGSGKFVNFHHFFEKGLLLSKEAIIRLFFVPFATENLAGRVCILQSSNQALSKLFVENIVNRNLNDLGKNMSKAVLKSEFNKPANSIFSFIDNALSHLKEFRNEISLPSLTMYHFTNYGPNPEIDIYQLPSSVFYFYSMCQHAKFKQDWSFFLRAHYIDKRNYSGAKFIQNKGVFEYSNKTDIQEVDYSEFKHWYNPILGKLLDNQSILGNILRWSKKHELNFEIISKYQQHIRGMKKEAIRKIKEIATFLVREQDLDKIKKRIQALDQVKNQGDLRRFLLKRVIVENHKEGVETAIIPIESYTEYLLPDGSSWSEIRDLLLIAIYQELHEKEMIGEGIELENEE